MVPWVKGFKPEDQYSPASLRRARGWLSSFAGGESLLPWESFPARAMYACFLVVLAVSATLSLKAVGNLFSVDWQQDSRRDALDFITVVLALTAVATASVLMSIVPWCAIFAVFVRWHCKACAKSSDDGDCTRFVRFRDPATQKRFAGKRISMETLYELYFDEKLDFVGSRSSAPNRDDAQGSACLLKDVLAKRSEFVDYRLSFRTHLRFLLTSWIPDVLGHSKSKDVGQVYVTASKKSSCTWYMHARTRGRLVESNVIRDGPLC